ncbi:MAG: nucleotidyltransferase domain-containing protein [Cetobacterium sp.]
MITKLELDKIVDKIVKNSPIKEVILFGSYASGKATEDSDIDLCLLLNNGIHEKRQILKKIRKSLLLEYKYPLDLLIYTSDEFKLRSQLEITFEHEIEEKGIRIYG